MTVDFILPKAARSFSLHRPTRLRF